MRKILGITASTTYTKHYYIGTERIASALGTMKNLGLLCEVVWPGDQTIITEMGTKTIAARNALIADYFSFEKDLHLPEPYLYETYICGDLDHHPENYDAYWYHPDHLGSSNYITNLAGTVNQHMEYLPFGETLVEDHLNSYNSPYKFNAKEFDAETGWYYYGARYYNPKWSIWLRIDPLAEEFPWQSPYVFTNNNPINFIDPDGRAAISVQQPDDWVLGKDGKYTWDANVTSATDADLNGREYIGKSTNDVASHYAENNPVSDFFGGSPEFGDTSTWPGEITKDVQTFADKWAESDNIAAEISYDIANDASLTIQAMNPFDSQVTTLQGHGVNDKITTEAGVSTISGFMPTSRVTNRTLKVMNAAQFSKAFKGTFMTKTSHSLRGAFNRAYNKMARKINEAELFQNIVEFGSSILNNE